VTGDVTLQLFKGSANVVGRQSPYALYDERFVTFGEDDVYQQSDAAGFIRLFALPQRVRALKDQEMAAAANGSAVSGKSAVTSKSGGAPASERDATIEEDSPKSPSLVLV
jgi:argininosuccinate synthase